MRIIKKKTLVDYYTREPKAKDALEYWYEKAISRIEELYRLTDDSTPADDPLMKELDELGRAIEAYEDIYYPIAKPTLASVIRLRMYEMGLTQQKLAEKLHISSSRISSYINGKSDPSLKTARALSQTLGIDANTILGL